MDKKPNDTVTEPQKVKVQSLDPTGRAMEQTAPVVETPKKKNTGLIIGLIVGLVVLIGGITAAAVLMLGNKKVDPVATAMQRIMSGQAPQKVTIDGDINILIDNNDSLIKRINIDLDSDIVVGSMINTSSAVLTFTDKLNRDYSVKFNELYAANGDLFFEIEGAKTAIQESGLLDLTGESSMADGIVAIIEAADSTWIRISTDELKTMGQDALGNSPASCVANLVHDIDKNSNSAAELYNKHPFITSEPSTAISGKQGTVYLVGVDSENFASFINDMRSTELSESLYSCMGWDDNASVTEEDVARVVEKIPQVYVEVNGNYDFTRLYLESEINEGEGCYCPEGADCTACLYSPTASVTIDLGFDYPTNVNVTEPVEYTNYSDFIEKIFINIYKTDS